ncbi:MAG: AbrB/MazE/SpoVT family DNA-binding domain-containing protein [Defluviitaleaceae bacterium]|nr:AbrB/MazE/SpoVT family DNA-binding domain-containing protein [Defluviitaleaceae bacterium]
MEVVVSKWGNSSAVRLPKPYLKKLGIKENDTVKISIHDNVITIEKPRKIRTIREIALSETGLSLEEYMQSHPYDNSDYVEFGRLIKSLVFSTDIAIIRNINADAVVAVYPFTPQPIISHALIMASDIPVFCGVGGGTTSGNRVVHLASDAEFQGAFGVVLNSPTPNDTIKKVREVVDIPIVITVVNEFDDITSRIKSGAAILNVSAASRTPWLVEKIKAANPEAAIIATGGPSEQSIIDTVNAGADAITWTPPTTGEIFKGLMAKYRDQDEV